MNDLIIAYLIHTDHYAFKNIHALPHIQTNDRGTGVNVSWDNGSGITIDYSDLLGFIWSQVTPTTAQVK